MTKRIEIEVTESLAALLADAARTTRLGQNAVIIAALEAYLEGFSEYRKSLIAIDALASHLDQIADLSGFATTFKLVPGEAPAGRKASAAPSKLHLQPTRTGGARTTKVAAGGKKKPLTKRTRPTQRKK